MTLAFNVSNLGPLSQIGFDYKDVGTAVYLATGAYGWFKSRERTLSLEQTLAASGVSLAIVSTFNSSRYTKYRQDHGCTCGVARTLQNTITRIKLPKASTALEGHAGMMCLRALTLALLCFVDQSQIPAILKDILPRRLFHYDQEGEEFVIEGPSLAALIRYVQAINTEESIDDLRTKLLNRVDSQIQRVTNATMDDILISQQTEIGHIVGLVDWLLTPAAKRDISIYRTRSLRVWCLALVLSELGFELEADRTAVTEPLSLSKLERESEYYNHEARVVLVLASGWSTDQARKLSHAIHDRFHQRVHIPPRIITVRAFPAIAYADNVMDQSFRGFPADATDLERAFVGTFVFVRHKLSCESSVRTAAGLESAKDIDKSLYGALLEEPGAAQERDVLRALKRFFRHSCRLNDQDIPRLQSFVGPLLTPLICEFLVPWHNRRGESTELFEGDSRIMMDHILFSSIIAVFSLFINTDTDMTDKSGLDMEFIYTGPIWRTRGGGSILNKWFAQTMSFLISLEADYSSSQLRDYRWNMLVQKVTASSSNSAVPARSLRLPRI